MSISAIIKTSCSVYSGPSSSIYSRIGSVDTNEEVIVYGIEDNWFYIEYYAGSYKKRGYVYYSYVTNPNDINVSDRVYNGYVDSVEASTTVYTGPDLDIYATAGSLGAGESLTVLGEIVGSYVYVEYSTSSSSKRGYILTSRLNGNKYGVLGKVYQSSVNVYAGPSIDIYYKCGSVYDNEVVVILEKGVHDATSWYYIEFNTSTGRKRGYVPQSTINMMGSSYVNTFSGDLGYAVAEQDLAVRYGPHHSYPQIGSISAKEVITRLRDNVGGANYTYIEYQYSGGKKRGYVTPADAIVVPSNPLARVNTSTNVYYGPSEQIYASIGSVSKDEIVQIHGYEDNFFFIEYTTSTANKLGYVPIALIDNYNTILKVVPSRSYKGRLDVSTSNKSVYAGADSSYAQVGTVFNGEGLTVFNERIGDYTYVEYSSSNGTKRGYILTDALSGNESGLLARTSVETANLYAGPDTTYHCTGAVYETEYIVILNRDISTPYEKKWYFIEYNASSGRKRGYIEQEHVMICGGESISTIPEINVGMDLAVANEGLNIYYGPNANYCQIGSISQGERISVLGIERGFNYIEYNTSSKAKRGYAPSTSFKSTQVELQPVPTYSNVYNGTYGTSGNGRPLQYYKIGSGPNSLVTVFEIHGYEDAWAADGEELTKIGVALIGALSEDKVKGLLEDFTVYVIPSANPDGVLDGWTCNGPGRASVTSKIDNNRCFPVNFKSIKNKRNYTGTTALGSVESTSLKEAILGWKAQSDNMILLDIHGWLNMTLGDAEVAKYFNEAFSMTNKSLNNANGYLSRWVQEEGIKAALIELPFPSSPQSIIDNNYAGKFITATRALIEANTNSAAIPVTGVNLLPSGTINKTVGETVQLVASVMPANATNKNVTWSSNNIEVAAVDSNGRVTINGVGNATITVTTEDGHRSTSVIIHVEDNVVVVPVTGVTISPLGLISKKVGETVQLFANVMPLDATNKNVTWSSNNTEVATVDSNGLVTAIGTGSVIISVVTEDGYNMATKIISIEENIVPVTGITLTPSGTITKKVGETIQLIASITPANATNKHVTWSSNNTNVASVDTNGKVIAKGIGNAVITATADGGSITASVTFNIDNIQAIATGEVSFNNTKIYYGPGASLFPEIMTIDKQSVNILWKESKWYFIELSINGNTQTVRGYIAEEGIVNINGYVPSKELTKSFRFILQGDDVFTGPGPLELYKKAGSIGKDEVVTIFNEVEGSYSLIEYAITGSRKRKRGYILTDRIDPDTSMFSDILTSSYIESYAASNHLTTIQKDALYRINTYLYNEKILNAIKNNQSIVFLFEGAGLNTDTIYNKEHGKSKYSIDRYGAVTLVIKDHKIIFFTDQSSTLPDKPMLDGYDDGTYFDTPTIIDGVYNIYSKLHRSKYPAFGVANADVIRYGTDKWRNSTSTGINIHAGYNTYMYKHVIDASDNDRWSNSVGCQIISMRDHVKDSADDKCLRFSSDEADRDCGIYHEFTKSIGLVNKNIFSETTGNVINTSYNNITGVVVIDREFLDIHNETLQSIYGTDGLQYMRYGVPE